MKIKLSQTVILDTSKDAALREALLETANAQVDEEDEVESFSDLDPAEVHDALRTMLDDDINALDLWDDAELDIEVQG